MILFMFTCLLMYVPVLKEMASVAHWGLPALMEQEEVEILKPHEEAAEWGKGHIWLLQEGCGSLSQE